MLVSAQRCLSIDELREWLALDESSPTGISWLKSKGSRAPKGSPAFTCIGSDGYYTGRFNNAPVRAHIIMWALKYGVFPLGDIDHKDRDRLNNKFSNFRVVSRKHNLENCGGKGFSYDKRRNKFCAYISLDNVKKNLGSYLTELDARAEYIRAKLKYHEGYILNNH